jgi:hypothetical protein
MIFFTDAVFAITLLIIEITGYMNAVLWGYTGNPFIMLILRKRYEKRAVLLVQQTEAVLTDTEQS